MNAFGGIIFEGAEYGRSGGHTLSSTLAQQSAQGRQTSMHRRPGDRRERQQHSNSGLRSRQYACPNPDKQQIVVEVPGNVEIGSLKQAKFVEVRGICGESG